MQENDEKVKKKFGQNGVSYYLCIKFRGIEIS